MTTDAKGATCDACDQPLQPAKVTHVGDQRVCNDCVSQMPNAERAAELLDACRAGLMELWGQADADQFDKMMCAMAEKLRRNANQRVAVYLSIVWEKPGEVDE